MFYTVNSVIDDDPMFFGLRVLQSNKLVFSL